MKKLHLVLKHKWYDMIATGEKKEEYRDNTDYWECRIWCNRFDIQEVVFHRGYTNVTITKKVKSIEIGGGKMEWGGDPNKELYVIKFD